MCTARLPTLSSCIPGQMSRSDLVPEIPNPIEGTWYQRYPIPQKGNDTRDTHPHLWTKWLKDTCENITFLQLRWRAVKMHAKGRYKLIVWNNGRVMERTVVLLIWFSAPSLHCSILQVTIFILLCCRLQEVPALLQENDTVFLDIWLVQEYARHLPYNIRSISDEMYASITRKQWQPTVRS